MLHWSLVFLVLAILAAIFGFGMAASAFASIAKVLAIVFLVIFILGLVTRRGTTV